METDSTIDAETMRITMEGYGMITIERYGDVMRKTGSYSEFINGQDVEFAVFEGEDINGTPIKAILTDVFNGKEGMVIISIIGYAAKWDQAMVDQFVDSIH